MIKKNRTMIIAEAGVNHNGEIELAKKLIDAAAFAGADAVKFQLFVPELLVSPKAQMSLYQQNNMGKKMSQMEMLKQYVFDEKILIKLIEYAKKRRISLLITPFDNESLKVVKRLGRPYIKVDSGAITDHPFLEKIAKTGIPVILSTGASTVKEIKEAVAVIEQYHRKICILHCTSLYPSPYNKINLNAIVTMMKAFKYPVGYSDHSIGIEVAIAAVAMGAKVIEKHFTLNKKMKGPDHKASIDPYELVAMVRAIRNVEDALGSFEKKPSPDEKTVMKNGRRSIVALQTIARNDKWNKSMVNSRI